MATGTRKKKTAVELKAALAAAKRKVAMLEQKAYEGELIELINATPFISEYNKLKESFANITNVAILSAIAKAVGAKGIQITQAPAVKRNPKATGTTKSAKTSAKPKTAAK